MNQKLKRPLLALLASVALVLGTNGCGSLVPKKVELFQKKVRALPDKSEKQCEYERQAAAIIVDRASSASVAARVGDMVRAQADLKDISAAGAGLVVSLGPPLSGWSAEVQALAVVMLRETAKLNGKLDAYRDRVDPLEGKKIEGTGLIQIPYLLWAGGFVVVLVVGIVILRVLLAALAMSNPGVAVGMNAVRVGGRAVSGMFSQVLKGGKVFKDGIDQVVEDPALRQKVLDWFAAAHDKAQDEQTRVVVKTLVKED